MLAVNYTNLRDNMKTYMDKVTDDYETIIVTRKDNRNIVMLSEKSYNNMMEMLIHICLTRKMSMNKLFTDNGWKDYVYWQTEDRKTSCNLHTQFCAIFALQTGMHILRKVFFKHTLGFFHEEIS